MSRRDRYAMVILAALTACGAPAGAATIRVDQSGGGDVLNIQAGLNAAAAGDTVLVAPGTYTGAGNRDLSFGGRDMVLRSEAGAEATVIDCQANMGDLHSAFLFTAGESTAAVVEGFTITRGINTMGGGVRCIAASPTLRDCIFTFCGFGYGGGIYCEDSYARFENCRFTANEAGLGGAIHARNAFPAMIGCRFEDNVGDLGGAVFCSDGGNAKLRDCSFANNVAESDGGGMWCGYAPATLENVVFEAGNSATDFGGGLYLAGDAVLVDVHFAGNEARNGGGMFSGWGNAVTLTDVHFSDNHAQERGGGLFCLDSFPWLDQTRFVANSAVLAGGGMHADWGGPRLSHSIFSRNSAADGAALSCTWYTGLQCSNVSFSLSQGGSAVFCEDSSPVFLRCIIAGSTTGGAMDCTGWSEPAVDHCCLFGNAGGDDLCVPSGDNLLLDPLFCDPAGDNLTLDTDSPCLPANNPWGDSLGALGQGCTGGSGVEEGGPNGFALLAPYPNPCRGATQIRLQLGSAPRETRVGIYSVAGRLLREYSLAASGGAGPRVLLWDGRDSAGAEAASGIYLVKAQQGGSLLGCKLVIAR